MHRSARGPVRGPNAPSHTSCVRATALVTDHLNRSTPAHRRASRNSRVFSAVAGPISRNTNSGDTLMNATLKLLPLAVSAALVTLPSVHAAQDNVGALSNFKQTGNTTPAEQVPQTGTRADALRENLKSIKLPPGFKIVLYAVVPDARHMAIEPSTGVVFVGTRKARVWQVTDRTKRRVADDVVAFASSVTFKVPNGVCLSPAGRLYV